MTTYLVATLSIYVLVDVQDEAEILAPGTH